MSYKGPVMTLHDFVLDDQAPTITKTTTVSAGEVVYCVRVATPGLVVLFQSSNPALFVRFHEHTEEDINYTGMKGA